MSSSIKLKLHGLILCGLLFVGCASVGKECCGRSAALSPDAKFDTTPDPRAQLLKQILDSLKSADLEQEFIGIPVVESSLNPNAKGRDGSAGLWQFQPRTAKAFGLKVSGTVDERLCPDKSTEAAIRYLKHLKKRFRSVDLTIAAYQLGEGRLAKILARRNHMPEVSKRYVRKVLDSHKLALSMLNSQSNTFKG